MMKRKKPLNDLLDSSLQLGGASLGIGLGSSIVKGAGGDPAALDTLGKFTPSIAKVKGGNILMNTLLDVNDDLQRKMKRRR